MNLEGDYKLALRLQKQIDEEEKKRRTARDDVEILKFSKPSTSFAKPLPNPTKTVSLVDSSLEYTDPNPDIHALFINFNDTFFWGKLLAVEVKWSPRMTSCAGICCYQGRGGLCSIRLSLPLLKLRPRKDLVETLLHEMIHAYLFVTHNNRDREGHGPEFHKHMHRINQSAGTKITVYHSFHDEVNVYKQHWWQCQGPCRHRRPYFGMVRRAMNRPPGPNDLWWKEHKATCGGQFVKVREPEGFSSSKKGKNSVKGKSEKASSNSIPTSHNNKSVQSSSSSGIQKYFSPTKSISVNGSKKGSEKGSVISKPSLTNVSFPKNRVTKKIGSISDGDVKQIVPPKTASTGVPLPKNFIPKKPTKKIGSISDGDVKQNVPPKTASTGVPLPKNFIPKKPENTAIINKGVVSTEKGNKFVPFSGVGRVLGSLKSSDGEPPLKKAKEEVKVKCPVCSSLQPEASINEHLDKCIGEDKTSAKEQWQVECPGCRVKVDEEAFDDHLEECMTKRPPEEIILSSDDEEDLKGNRENLQCVCPACGKTTDSHSLAQHLDVCLSSMSFEEDMD